METGSGTITVVVMSDDRSEALKELVGHEVREVGFDPDIHVRVAFASGATLDLYRMPEVQADGRRLGIEDDGFPEALASLVERRVTNAEATGDRLVIELGPSDGLGVQLGGSVDDVSSYDVAVFRPVEAEPVIVWSIEE
jgi:hypothetical protein